MERKTERWISLAISHFPFYSWFRICIAVFLESRQATKGSSTHKDCSGILKSCPCLSQIQLGLDWWARILGTWNEITFVSQNRWTIQTKQTFRTSTSFFFFQTIQTWIKHFQLRALWVTSRSWCVSTVSHSLQAIMTCDSKVAKPACRKSSWSWTSAPYEPLFLICVCFPFFNHNHHAAVAQRTWNFQSSGPAKLTLGMWYTDGRSYLQL